MRTRLLSRLAHNPASGCAYNIINVPPVYSAVAGVAILPSVSLATPIPSLDHPRLFHAGAVGTSSNMIRINWTAPWACLLCILVSVANVAGLPLSYHFPSAASAASAAAAVAAPAATMPKNHLPSWVVVKLATSNLPTTFNNRFGHTRHGSGTRIPAWHTGPWDQAWSLWDDVSTKIAGTIPASKLRKRALGFNVEREIINHLRPDDWLQRTKDFSRSLFGLKLHVTPQQYASVASRYRSQIPASAYRSRIAASSYRSRIPASAFPYTRPNSFAPRPPSGPVPSVHPVCIQRDIVSKASRSAKSSDHTPYHASLLEQ
ncbi:hypothetical protein PaG_03291 [Moesziomyces aphidis]|uniref:Uncharacterized protein n=1 Tax=Moesziomyces aphidis TaxID=84754 RepID=W3VPF4_MOEAP|nr:hypothetical protein PaG_03291 [Moesziomyces aphidis]